MKIESELQVVGLDGNTFAPDYKTGSQPLRLTAHWRNSGNAPLVFIQLQGEYCKDSTVPRFLAKRRGVYTEQQTIF
jgi:hypothetical protein